MVQLLRSITIDSAIFDEVSKIFASSMANDAIIILSFLYIIIENTSNEYRMTIGNFYRSA